MVLLLSEQSINFMVFSRDLHRERERERERKERYLMSWSLIGMRIWQIPNKLVFLHALFTFNYLTLNIQHIFFLCLKHALLRLQKLWLIAVEKPVSSVHLVLRSWQELLRHRNGNDKQWRQIASEFLGNYTGLHKLPETQQTLNKQVKLKTDFWGNVN